MVKIKCLCGYWMREESEDKYCCPKCNLRIIQLQIDLATNKIIVKTE